MGEGQNLGELVLVISRAKQNANQVITQFSLIVVNPTLDPALKLSGEESKVLQSWRSGVAADIPGNVELLLQRPAIYTLAVTPFCEEYLHPFIPYMQALVRAYNSAHTASAEAAHLQERVEQLESTLQTYEPVDDSIPL